MARKRVGYGIVGTHCKAVKANHAAAHIRNVVVEIYTRGLANVDATAALGATVGVDVDMKRRVPRNQPKRRRQRTHGVAKKPAAPIGGQAYSAEHNAA